MPSQSDIAFVKKIAARAKEIASIAAKANQTARCISPNVILRLKHASETLQRLPPGVFENMRHASEAFKARTAAKELCDAASNKDRRL